MYNSLLPLFFFFLHFLNEFFSHPHISLSSPFLEVALIIQITSCLRVLQEQQETKPRAYDLVQLNFNQDFTERRQTRTLPLSPVRNIPITIQF